MWEGFFTVLDRRNARLNTNDMEIQMNVRLSRRIDDIFSGGRQTFGQVRQMQRTKFDVWRVSISTGHRKNQENVESDDKHKQRDSNEILWPN